MMNRNSVVNIYSLTAKRLGDQRTDVPDVPEVPEGELFHRRACRHLAGTYP